MERKRYSSGTAWEPIVGYSRAIKAGNHIYVSGTTPVGENGEIECLNDPYGQAELTIKNISKALEALGSGLKDVVRTRIYVTDIKDWEQVGRAHGFYFKEILPATTLVEVSALISPDIIVEIEAVAIV